MSPGMGEKVRPFCSGRWRATGLVALPVVFLFACRQYQPVGKEAGKPLPQVADRRGNSPIPTGSSPENGSDPSVFSNQELSHLSRQALAPVNLPDDPELKVNLPDGSVSLSSRALPLKMSATAGQESIGDKGLALPKAMAVPPPSPEAANMYPRGYYGN